MPDEAGFTFTATEADSDQRLDSLIAEKLPRCSRKLATSLIRQGLIHVYGSTKKPGYRIRPGDVINGVIPEPTPVRFQPEPIHLDILFEDNDIIVLNKAPGVVVHPAPGNYTGTLVNGLLYHCPDLEGIGGQIRPGIVHRLDKGTSGVLLVAKNQTAHTELSHQFKSRRVDKKYLSLVHGVFKEKSGEVTLPIGRHPTHRKKMSVHTQKPKQAKTLWKVTEQYDGLTLLEISLLTGRTHQIRVHCDAIHHPVVGDPVYGIRGAGRRISRLKQPGKLIQNISRQMLHAWRLSIDHPITRQRTTFTAPLPEDMQALLENLRSLSAQKNE